MKAILTMVLVAMISTASFATKTSAQEAKKQLKEDIGYYINKDINSADNYFNVNNIRRVKEDIKVSFYVNTDRELVLMQVNTENWDAKKYVKHFFKGNTMKVNSALIGHAFSINLHLVYKAG